MKTVVMIPYWHDYKYPDESISKRDDLKIAGHTLIDRTVRVVQNLKSVDDVIIYASNDKVLELLDDSTVCNIQKRDADLDLQSVSIEDIIERFLMTCDAEIIVLMHPRSPLIKAKSIAECIDKVANEGFESAFIASRYRKFAWFKGEPINYSLKRGENTQNLSSIEPVIMESSSVYVFTRKLFKETRRRVSRNPYMKFVGPFEGFEINYADDYEMVELIINAGLDVVGN